MLRWMPLVFTALLLFCWDSLGAVAATPRDKAPITGVRVAVLSVSPLEPAASAKLKPMTVQLVVTNATAQTLTDVQVAAERGYPITRSSDLSTTLASTSGRQATGITIKGASSAAATVRPGATAHLQFKTTTGLPANAGLCLCAPHAIYPLYFSVSATGATGKRQVVATATTFVPSFFQHPVPVSVVWLWPLLDRPHRAISDIDFLDNDLAGEVAPGGRLDRALRVLNDLPATVPVTGLLDLELLDELTVIATGHYTVRGKRVDSSDSAQAASAATAWLALLRALLARPNIAAQSLPWADPDVAATQVAQVSWSANPPKAMQTRITTAIGRPLPSPSLVLPSSGSLTATDLHALTTRGITSTILRPESVRPNHDADGLPYGLVQLPSGGSNVSALLADADTEQLLAQAVQGAGNGNPGGSLSRLAAKVTIGAAQEPTTGHVVVLTPPRYVDPDVAAATAAITQISRLRTVHAAALSDEVRSPEATSRTLSTAEKSGQPSNISRALRTAASDLRASRSLLETAQDSNARTAIGNLMSGLQRASSTAWASQPAAGVTFLRDLQTQLDTILEGVQLVQPSTGFYTLSSSNSPLPVTVSNSLPYAVRVVVQVRTERGLPGLTVGDSSPHIIKPRAKTSLHLHANVQRSGRFKVTVTLLAPNGTSLGSPTSLSIHSSAAFALIGKLVTLVAGVVLAIGLIVRGTRHIMRQRRPVAPLTEYPASS